MTFGGQPASALAKKAVTEAIQAYKEIFDDFTSNTPHTAKDLLDRLDAVQANLDTAGSMSEEAAKEPRFWRQSWRPSLFNVIVTGFTRLTKLLRVLINVTLADEAESTQLNQLLKSLGSWPKILSEVDSCLGFTTDLALYLLHMNRPDEVAGLSKVLSQSLDETLPMNDLINDMNTAGKVKSITPRDTRETLSGLSIAVETLFSFMHQMRRMQHQLVLQKCN